MRIAFILLLAMLVGCVSAPSEAKVQALLTKGYYREAIVEIERHRQSADERFALGLLYGYRELKEKGTSADFSEAISLIRSVSREVEEARRLVADYDQRGDQVFYAFPWAHMIGPFPERLRPQSVKAPNKAPEPTITSVTIRAYARLAPAALVAHL